MESNLSLNRTQLAAKIGDFFGYGRGADYSETTWTAAQTAKITDCVDSGYRQFINPPPLAPGGESYEWSFLNPVATLVLASGASTIDLPDDFGGLRGDLLITTTGRLPIPVIVSGDVRVKQALLPDTTGQPQYAEMEPIKGTSPTTGQRFRLRVWPTADQEYTLQADYFIHPDAITSDRPYAYGGMQHAETLLESCLAIAEERYGDRRGVHAAKFVERLAASISLDRKLKPQKLGYNRDGSDRAGIDRRAWVTPTTVYGTRY